MMRLKRMRKYCASFKWARRMLEWHPFFFEWSASFLPSLGAVRKPATVEWAPRMREYNLVGFSEWGQNPVGVEWERWLPACFESGCFVLRFLFLLIVSFANPSISLAVETDYLPICKDILIRRVSQHLIQDGITCADGVIRGEHSSIRVAADRSVSIFGSDRFGKPWTLIANSPSGAVSAWSADLDNNGTNDLVLFMPAIGADSWAPNAKVLLLMFEKNGRPVPWCTTGFFSVDKYGLKELVDINDDGKPELVSQTRSARYWITSIFETSNCRWLGLKEFAGQALPFHTQFTAKANHSIIRPQMKRCITTSIGRALKCQANEISKLTVLSVDWSRTESGESVVVAKQNNCLAINSPVGDATVVMLDDMRGRRISIGSTLISRRLLEEMGFRKLHVALSVDGTSATRTTTLVYARVGQSF